jgi:hypothetical protein
MFESRVCSRNGFGCYLAAEGETIPRVLKVRTIVSCVNAGIGIDALLVMLLRILGMWGIICGTWYLSVY